MITFEQTPFAEVKLFQIDQVFDPALSKTIFYRDPEIALDIRDRDFIVSPKDAEAPLLSSIQLKS